MEFRLSLMASYTTEEDTSISMGSPLTTSRPTITALCSSSSGRAQPRGSFKYMAVFCPITRLKFRFRWLIMDSSIRFPPNKRRSLSTSPPREITEISVVSAPIFTIINPVGELTSSSSPTASAMGFSQRSTLLGLNLLL